MWSPEEIEGADPIGLPGSSEKRLSTTEKDDQKETEDSPPVAGAMCLEELEAWWWDEGVVVSTEVPPACWRWAESFMLQLRASES